MFPLRQVDRQRREHSGFLLKRNSMYQSQQRFHLHMIPWFKMFQRDLHVTSKHHAVEDTTRASISAQNGKTRGNNARTRR